MKQVLCRGDTGKNQTVSCENKFAHAHVRARTHVCDVRAKRLLKRACDVRACGRPGVRRAIAIFARFWVKKGPILDFILPGKYKKSAKFASKLPLCYKRACACAIRILAKRTRACDVRAAENRVCECACVRGKKSSQLTDCYFVFHGINILLIVPEMYNFAYVVNIIRVGSFGY